MNKSSEIRQYSELNNQSETTKQPILRETLADLKILVHRLDLSLEVLEKKVAFLYPCTENDIQNGPIKEPSCFAEELVEVNNFLYKRIAKLEIILNHLDTII